MTITRPTPPDFNLDADPEFQALLAQLRQSTEAVRTEFAVEQQRSEIEAASAPPEPEIPVPPEPDPAQFAAWDAMGKVTGLPLEVEVPTTGPGRAPRQVAEELANIGTEELVENVTEGALKATARRLSRPSRARVQRQWHYAQENNTVRPVSEKELIKLLESGDLPWSTLVWNRSLSNWTAARDTELADLVESAAPPPLPVAGEHPVEIPSDEIICPKCGHAAKANDRFCSGCGEPLLT